MTTEHFKIGGVIAVIGAIAFIIQYSLEKRFPRNMNRIKDGKGLQKVIIASIVLLIMVYAWMHQTR